MNTTLGFINLDLVEILAHQDPSLEILAKPCLSKAWAFKWNLPRVLMGHPMGQNGLGKAFVKGFIKD